jgi:hypothetical protein
VSLFVNLAGMAGRRTSPPPSDTESQFSRRMRAPSGGGAFGWESRIWG